MKSLIIFNLDGAPAESRSDLDSENATYSEAILGEFCGRSEP
jgi:hypothetical protein